MPYITPELRDSALYNPMKAGELNYAVTSVLVDYIALKGKSYQTYNDIIGVLECAKLELYRRLISILEDQKCYENGDVYK